MVDSGQGVAVGPHADRETQTTAIDPAWSPGMRHSRPGAACAQPAFGVDEPEVEPLPPTAVPGRDEMTVMVLCEPAAALGQSQVDGNLLAQGCHPYMPGSEKHHLLRPGRPPAAHSTLSRSFPRGPRGTSPAAVPLFGPRQTPLYHAGASWYARGQVGMAASPVPTFR